MGLSEQISTGVTHNREYFFLSFSSSRRRRRFVLRRRPFHEQKLFSQLEVEWAKKFACAVEWAGSNNGRWPSRGQKRLRERAEKICVSFCVRCQDFLLCCLRPSWVTATRARADKRRGEGAANYCLWFIFGGLEDKRLFCLNDFLCCSLRPSLEVVVSRQLHFHQKTAAAADV